MPSNAEDDVLQVPYVAKDKDSMNAWRNAAVPLFLQRFPQEVIPIAALEADVGASVSVAVQVALVANEYVPAFAAIAGLRTKLQAGLQPTKFFSMFWNKKRLKCSRLCLPS